MEDVSQSPRVCLKHCCLDKLGDQFQHLTLPRCHFFLKRKRLTLGWQESGTEPLQRLRVHLYECGWHAVA